MITESDDAQQRSDDRTVLVWSVLVSGFVNLMVWMVAAWTIVASMRAIATPSVRPTPEMFMVASTSIHVAPHSHPVPQRPQTQPSHQQQQVQPKRPQPQPQPTAPRRTVPTPEAKPTEIARIVPSAPPQPRSAPKRTQQASLAEQLAQQEVAFQREAQQLNAQNAPLSVATIDPNQRASAVKQFHINFSGDSELQDRGEGVMMPLRSWTDNGLHCYYGRYYWQYPTGGTEVANVPWPFCFTPRDDPFPRGVRQFPFPLPLPGYRVPPGTYLYPIEKEVYEAWLAHQ
jgi:outer membrane biosynthesis protein TonB